MQQESVNSLTLEKHEMYCDCDAITKFDNNTCMSKYIINDNCCNCSTCSNGGSGSGGDGDGGVGGNAEEKNANGERKGKKYRKTTKNHSNPIASNGRCISSERFCSTSNQLLNGQRRRKRRRRSQWSSRWYFDFSKVLFVFVFCSNELFQFVQGDRSIDNTIRTVVERPVIGASTWTTTYSTLPAFTDESSTEPTATNARPYEEHSTDDIDANVLQLNQYKNHNTLNLRQHSNLGSDANPVQSQPLRSDAMEKSSSPNLIFVKTNKISNNINRKSSNEHNTNDLINNIYNIDEHFKLPLKRLMHILSSQQNYSNISSSNQVSNNYNKIIYDSNNNKLVDNISKNNENNYYDTQLTHNNHNNDNDNDNYSRIIFNNNSNSTIDNSSQKFDIHEFYLRITSNNDDKSINSKELIKISNDLSKLRRQHNKLSSYDTNKLNLIKIENNNNITTPTSNISNSINDLTSIKLSLLNNNYSNDEPHNIDAATPAIRFNNSHLRRIYDAKDENDKAPEEESIPDSDQIETTCANCIHNNNDNPFDKKFMKKSPSSKVTPHTLESSSLSSLPPEKTESAATAINSLNLSTSNNSPISIRLRNAINLQKMHQPKNKYPKTTSNITKTTTKLMTNQKLSNNLIYVDENDVTSSAPTIEDMNSTEKNGRWGGSRTDGVSVEGNAEGMVLKRADNANGAIADPGTREYVPLTMENAGSDNFPLNRTTRKYLSTSGHENAATRELVHVNQTRREQLKQNIFSNYPISIENNNPHNMNSYRDKSINLSDDDNNLFSIERNLTHSNNKNNNDNLHNENHPNLSESIDDYKNNNNTENHKYIKIGEGSGNQFNDENDRIGIKKKAADLRSNNNNRPTTKYENGMPEEDFRKLSNDQMRLESIKYQILTKLGLKRKPNITQTLPKHIIMSTLSRANEARMDTKTFRSHRSRYKTFNLYTADGNGERDAYPQRAGEANVHHIANDGYDYYNDELHQYPEIPVVKLSPHNNATSKNEQNSNPATPRPNKMHYSHHRSGDDDDNYYGPYDNNDDDFDSDQDELGSADDFHGRTREIIIFAEKGE